jgi:hypothetical protein
MLRSIKMFFRLPVDDDDGGQADSVEDPPVFMQIIHLLFYGTPLTGEQLLRRRVLRSLSVGGGGRGGGGMMGGAFPMFADTSAAASMAPSMAFVNTPRFIQHHQNDRLKVVYMNILKANFSMFFFLLTHSLVWLLVASWYASYAMQYSSLTREYLWRDYCAFKHYDARHPYQWQDICGKQAKSRPPFSFLFITMFAVAGYGTWVTLPQVIALLVVSWKAFTKQRLESRASQQSRNKGAPL